jgi:hypothetical protein
MAAHDRIRLIDQLRKGPASAGLFYSAIHRNGYTQVLVGKREKILPVVAVSA